MVSGGRGRGWIRRGAGRTLAFCRVATGAEVALLGGQRYKEGMDYEGIVAERYSAGAKAREEALCCPVAYDGKYLDAIPQEVIERDYGCGDPSRVLTGGETVLDLGCGGGKLCFIAAQIVGKTGRVVGVDMNDEMLALARRAAPIVAERIGFANVEFHRARIQDLGLVAATGSFDVVMSNCVLNLVQPDDREALFREIHRVLRDGGRAVISDIVSDKDVPPTLEKDPELWSGCVSGAFREEAFVAAFGRAGFSQIEVLERQSEPWRVVQGIQFRSLTALATKGGRATRRNLPRAEQAGCCS